MEFRLDHFGSVDQPRRHRSSGSGHHHGSQLDRISGLGTAVAEQRQCGIQAIVDSNLRHPLRLGRAYRDSKRGIIGLLTMKGTVRSLRCPPAGFMLLDALITIVILTFGLLGFAQLQVKMQVAQSESYQRAQATLLVQDMANRLSTNRSNATSYLTSPAYVGTGDSNPAGCTSLSGAQKDLCEWSNQLKGTAEIQNAAAIGAMTGARGCIDLVSNNPDVYRVTVAWQGLSPLSAPAFTCGQNLYGSEDSYRRAIARLVAIASLTGA